jgi:hypothetical protein
VTSEVEVEVEDNLRPTVSRPVCLGVRHPSGTRDQFFFLLEIFFRQLWVCNFVVPSLMRGRALVVIVIDTAVTSTAGIHTVIASSSVPIYRRMSCLRLVPRRLLQLKQLLPAAEYFLSPLSTFFLTQFKIIEADDIRTTGKFVANYDFRLNSCLF